jgi:hypothetical protein
MPMRETSRGGIAPVPRPAPPRASPGLAEPARPALADTPGRTEDPRATTGPRPRIGDRLRAAGLAAGSGPRDPEPGQGGGDQRNETPSDVGTGLLPGAETGHLHADSGPAGRAEGAPPGQVIVPPADSHANHERLPIFDAVETHWFSRGRQAAGKAGQGGQGWSSSADDGWRAAEVVHAPASDGTTPSGLPKRQPQANLVPGTAAAGTASETPPRPRPSRSAEENRNRFASFQRGIRRGRAAATGVNPTAERARPHETS